MLAPPRPHRGFCWCAAVALPLALAAFFVGLIVIGCSAPPAAHDGPNVVLVTLDTLRADRLGSYGAAGDLTPHLDALAAGGLRFTAAACPMPVTRPSHFTMLTSLYPRSHGALSNAASLPPGVLTVTEVLAAAGYRTAAFTGVKLLAPGSGAERGFEVFDAPERGEDRVAAEVVAQAQQWLRGSSPGSASAGPFFLWLHLYDPHMPYGPPEPWAAAPPRELAEELPIFSRPLLRPLLERTGGDLPGEVLAYALAQYAAEVSYTDHWVGQLLATLEEIGRAEDTLVVVVADHGECFGKGTYFEHGTCLDEGAVHVPLILRLPAPQARSGVVGGAVELLDLAPTILEVAGLPVPEVFAGRSLLAPRPADAVAVVEHPFYDPSAVERREERRDFLSSVAGDPIRGVEGGDLVTVRGERWKLMVGEGGRSALYDLAADPEERQDVAAEHPEVVETLRRHLRSWLASHPTPPDQPAVVDEELEKTLRSLGY